MIAFSPRTISELPLETNHLLNSAMQASTSDSTAALSSLGAAELQIMEATPDVAESIAEIEIQLFPNGVNEFSIRNEIATGYGWVIGQPICGYVLVQEQDGLYDITRVAVVPEMQGRGLGKRLLAKALSLPGPWLLTVRKSNLRAIKLYKEQGFIVEGALKSSWLMFKGV